MSVRTSARLTTTSSRNPSWARVTPSCRSRQDLQDFDGNLLILYGDTPLFRPASIRGLLNRHELKKAHLTLLTAVLDHPLPYGRIIRNADGQIMDIIEDTEASPEVREIREFNVGAYVVNARRSSPPSSASRLRPAMAITVSPTASTS